MVGTYPEGSSMTMVGLLVCDSVIGKLTVLVPAYITGSFERRSINFSTFVISPGPDPDTGARL